MKKLLFLLLFFLPLISHGAISYISSTDLTSTPGTSQTTSVNVGSGSNRGLVVTGVSSTGTDDLTGITYAGVAMTRIGAVAPTSGARWLYLYWLSNPTSGTNNLVVSHSASQPWFAGQASVYNGVNQSDTVDASNSLRAGGGATSYTMTLTTVADQAWIMGYISPDGYNPAATSPALERGTDQGNAGYGDSNAGFSPGSNSIAWTWSTSALFSEAHMSIAPAVAVASSPSQESDTILFE